MKGDIKLRGFSNRNWSRRAFGDEVYSALLDSGIPFWRWDRYEPERKEFEPSGRREFVQTWSQGMDKPFCSINVVTRRPKNIVMFTGGVSAKADAGCFSIVCDTRCWSPTGAQMYMGLAYRLMHVLECFHGAIHCDEEYLDQHGVECCKQEGDRLVHWREMIGIGYREYLPGIYWGNLFGPPIAEWLGVDRIRSCPCHHYREISPGYHLVIAYPDIASHNAPEAVAAKDAIREHLGAEHFFDRRFPDRRTVVPPLDFSELYRPRASKRDPVKVEALRKAAQEMGGTLEVGLDKITLYLGEDVEQRDSLPKKED